MDDAAEVFLSILKSIHSYKNKLFLNKEDDNLCSPNCVSHAYFRISLLEQDRCSCGTTCEAIPYDYNYFAYEVYLELILNKLKEREIESNMMSILKSLNVILSFLFSVKPIDNVLVQRKMMKIT